MLAVEGGRTHTSSNYYEQSLYKWNLGRASSGKTTFLFKNFCIFDLFKIGTPYLQNINK
jgi:hypothetical protein